MVKFVVTKTHLYWWPVKVRMPNPDPRRAGDVQEFTFKAQFEAIGTEEADEIIAELNALPAADRGKRQHDLLLRVVKGWNEDVIDEDKNPIEFSEAVFRDLLDMGWFAAGMWRAWGDSQRAEGGRRGN